MGGAPWKYCRARAKRSGLGSARAFVSQPSSTVPAKGAPSARTQIVVMTGCAAFGSVNMREGPARVTVDVPSVKVASHAPVASVTTVRAGVSCR